MHIQGGLLFMWGVFSSFRFRVSVAASQKTQFQYSENGKKHFSWDEIKIGLRGVPRHPKGHAGVRYGLVLIKPKIIMPDMGAACNNDDGHT
jgi:hypothetical protein